MPETFHYDLPRLRDGLRPVRLHWMPLVDSTSDAAIELRRAGELFCPAVAVAGRQTAGRGRKGDAWHSGPGGLSVTFAFATGDDAPPPQEIGLVCGVAVRRAVAEFGGGAIGLKWPNDLAHAGRKLAGLLCERIDGVDFVGIGVNLWPEIDWPAGVAAQSTTLADVTGRRPDKTDALLAVARHVRGVLLDAPTRWAAVRDEFLAHHTLADRRVAVDREAGRVEGVCAGVDPSGRLLVRDAGGVHAIVSGTVRTTDG